MIGGTDDELHLVAVALVALAEKCEVCGWRRPALLDALRTQLSGFIEGHSDPTDPTVAVSGENPLMLPLLLDYDLAARRVGVSRSTLKRWAADGLIEPVKVGGIVRFTPESLDRLVASLAAVRREVSDG